MARILLIDDDESIRFLVREELVLDGHHVETAADGSSGLEAVRHRPPDLVILDLKMPGLGGLDVLARLKAARPRLPVILFTAFGPPPGEEAPPGADAYVVKSPDLEPLKRTVRRVAPGGRG